MTQLKWVLKQDHATNDQDLQVLQQELPIELRRVLTRLYCAKLLRQGTRDAYQQFVAAQQNTAATSLSFSTFNKLGKTIVNLPAHDYEILETAIILAAVSLSQPAAMLARQNMDIEPISHDKLEFMAITLRNSLKLYPLTEKISQNNVIARKLLYILFPPQTNFQHMLYTEGGIGMFKYLRIMITHGYADNKAMQLLYAYWIVNMAGFRGHISQQGSLYMTENVAQAILKLQSLISEMLEIPNFDPLIPYLEYRARLLGLQDLPHNEKLFITHIGCMLRLYTISDGQRLQKAILQLPLQDYTATMQYFLQGLQDPNQLSIRYAPALFSNSLTSTQGSIEQVIAKILPIYNKAILNYATKEHQVAISFKKLAAKNNLKYLLLANNVNTQYLQIDAHGNVTLDLNH